MRKRLHNSVDGILRVALRWESTLQPGCFASKPRILRKAVAQRSESGVNHAMAKSNARERTKRLDNDMLNWGQTDRVVDWMEKQRLAGVGKTHSSSSASSPQNFKSLFFVASIPRSRYLTKGKYLWRSPSSLPRQLYQGALTHLFLGAFFFFFFFQTTLQPRTRMAAEEDEDDYMSMVIEEPQQKETFTQKKRRLQREASPRPSPHCHAAITKPQTPAN